MASTYCARGFAFPEYSMKVSSKVFNIFIYDCKLQKFQLPPFTEYNDTNISILLLSRDIRIFPLISNDGISMFSDKDTIFIDILKTI